MRSLIAKPAVGVSDPWTPDETVFAAGWAELATRHPLELGRAATNPRQSVLRLAKKLLLVRALSKALEAGERLEAEEGAQKPEGWDPARVARHLERAVAQAFQAYRRARWLRRLHDSDIVYREPDGSRVRRLQVRGGEIIDESDVALDRAPSVQAGVGSIPQVQPIFDRTKYDRLRILSTELKRISRDGGAVAVHWGLGRRIPARLLAGVLRVV